MPQEISGARPHEIAVAFQLSIVIEAGAHKPKPWRGVIRASAISSVRRKALSSSAKVAAATLKDGAAAAVVHDLLGSIHAPVKGATVSI